MSIKRSFEIDFLQNFDKQTEADSSERPSFRPFLLILFALVNKLHFVDPPKTVSPRAFREILSEVEKDNAFGFVVGVLRSEELSLPTNCAN